jgi:hypothetical protein
MPHLERRWMALALVSIVSACAPRQAPEGWRPSIHEVQSRPRGSWIVIEIDDGRRAYGELLAIDASARIAYLEMLGTIARVPLARIRGIELTFHRGEAGKIGAWGAAGTVSTLSHGLVLFLSAPIWLITTGVAAAVESSGGTIRATRDSLTPEEFAGLRKYARFPQGLPAGFTLQREAAPAPTQQPPDAPAASGSR